MESVSTLVHLFRSRGILGDFTCVFVPCIYCVKIFIGKSNPYIGSNGSMYFVAFKLIGYPVFHTASKIFIIPGLVPSRYFLWTFFICLQLGVATCVPELPLLGTSSGILCSFFYVDIQSLAIPDEGLKFHEGIYHLVIQFCLNEWDTHTPPAWVLLRTSGTQYSVQYKLVLTLEVPRGYVSLNNILFTFEARALCPCSSYRHLP